MHRPHMDWYLYLRTCLPILCHHQRACHQVISYFSQKQHISLAGTWLFWRVTRLLNSLSAMSPTFAIRTLAVPSFDTVTVTFAFIVSYVTVVSLPLTSSTV